MLTSFGDRGTLVIKNVNCRERENLQNLLAAHHDVVRNGHIHNQHLPPDLQIYLNISFCLASWGIFWTGVSATAINWSSKT